MVAQLACLPNLPKTHLSMLNMGTWKIIDSKRKLVEFEFMYLKAQRSGNMSDTMPRGHLHRGVYSIVRDCM